MNVQMHARPSVSSAVLDIWNSRFSATPRCLIKTIINLNQYFYKSITSFFFFNRNYTKLEIHFVSFILTMKTERIGS